MVISSLPALVKREWNPRLKGNDGNKIIILIIIVIIKFYRRDQKDDMCRIIPRPNGHYYDFGTNLL